MKTNWNTVGIEFEGWKIPDAICDQFEADGDAGKFRNAARQFTSDEEAIDAKIREIEA